MKFDYLRISHMRVKWNEFRYEVFAGWENLVPIIHIRTLRNVKFVVQDRFLSFYTSEKKNHTSSSQTLYKFVPSETEVKTFEILEIYFTTSTPSSKFNIHKCHNSKMILVGAYFYTDMKLKIDKSEHMGSFKQHQDDI